MGERTTRYSPNGGEMYVDVCQLCLDDAFESGWRKEGSPHTPTIPVAHKRGRFSLAALLGTKPARSHQVTSDPAHRRLSESELAVLEAADIFNASQYRRTVGGIAKSLGIPNVSIVPLSGVNREIVITVAWEISWYQYRVTPDAASPVRLAERGHDPGELDGAYAVWNGRVEVDGRVVPKIAAS